MKFKTNPISLSLVIIIPTLLIAIIHSYRMYVYFQKVKAQGCWTHAMLKQEANAQTRCLYVYKGEVWDPKGGGSFSIHHGQACAEDIYCTVRTSHFTGSIIDRLRNVAKYFKPGYYVGDVCPGEIIPHPLHETNRPDRGPNDPNDPLCQSTSPTPTIKPPTSTPTIKPTTTPTKGPTPTKMPSPTPGGKPGDANGDGKVDFLDYAIWLGNSNRTAQNGPTQGDFNLDGKVDGLDFTMFINNYSGTITPPPPVNPSPSPSPGPNTLIYESNFETGAIQCETCNPDGWYEKKYAPDAILVKSSPENPVREGTFSLTVHVDKDDNFGSNSPLAELATWPNNYFFNVKKEYWLGLSIFIPDAYQIDTAQSETLVQIRQRDLSCDYIAAEPPHALQLQSGSWKWLIRSSADQCLTTSPPPIVLDIGPLQKAKWTDFVARFYFSWENNAMLQVWKDGNLVIDRINQPNYYNRQYGPYLKIGFAKPLWKSQNSDVITRTLYFDSVRIYEGSNGFNAVVPGK